jgi:Pyruvate/2-oxoacid:ferredoxin oxidoreductase gamma subunit
VLVLCARVEALTTELSLRKFASQVEPGGLILYNSERLPEDLPESPARVICIPASEIADKLCSPKAANIVLLGALLEETECLAPETALSLIETKLKKVELQEINRQALAAGKNFIDSRCSNSTRWLRILVWRGTLLSACFVGT